jgi:hypothetical protein
MSVQKEVIVIMKIEMKNEAKKHKNETMQCTFESNLAEGKNVFGTLQNSLR